MHVKKNDEVLVLAGNDRGKTGRVLKVLPKSNRVLVEGINVRVKHLRRSQASPQGGRVEHEFPIHASNVKKASA
ncbi:MAG: 50S ribosomal protein L24 [Planctomycetota bacterium]|nr:50S ribosomal protein L24 [Planctomycetota bacterium]